jgi:acid phosphatase type 7
MIPTRGNHDGGPLYKEIFDLSKDETCYYLCNLSKDVALITLDTNIAASGLQLDFLGKSLEENKSTKWLLTQYHRPIYPAVKSPYSGKKEWTALFDKYNLDLALEADGHVYKRTLPIKHDKHDPKGTVYVGEGCMGVGLRKPKSDLWYLQSPGKSGAFHHVMKLEFTANKLNYSAITFSNKVMDTYTFTAQNR